MGARVLLEGKGARGEILSRIVSEKSRVIARGYIEGANVGTKGHMECNGILLDDAASIYAIPELKGAHPDTGLSHEAAVGKIAGEQLNYLMSRGIDEDTAKSLIVRGFLDVKIEGLPPTLQKSIDKMIKKAAMREAI